jgi:hypothetical protein
MSHVVGAAAVTGLGAGWRGLGRVLLRGERVPTEVPRAAAEIADARAAKLMSRSARLAAIGARAALAEAGWSEGRSGVGYYLGVGASAGDLAEILPLLRAALGEGRLSLARLGSEGLPGCPPLLSFQLLNNFTLCHGAILEGLGGPNAAFFSRGGGTVAALDEALHVLEVGECDRLLVGGADCGPHPVTGSELGREANARLDVAPAEAAGLLALGDGKAGALAKIEGCTLLGAGDRWISEVVAAAATSDLDQVFILACSRAGDHQALAGALAGWTVLDAQRCFGETLAAGPALAWLAGLDLVASGAALRATVISRALDGDVGVVRLRRPGSRA